VPPFTWSGSGLPAGVSLSAGGVFSGTPSAAGTSTVSVTVTDSTGATAGRSFTVTVALPTTPPVNVTGLPTNANPGTQANLQIGLGSPYPIDVNVTATLTFAADSGPDDPAVQF